MNLLLSRKLSTLLLAGYALLLACLSLSPAAAPPAACDKALHMLAYCLLVMLGAPLVRGPGAGFLPGAVLAAAALVYGLALELGQAVVPGRVASSWDVAANAAGVALGLAILFSVKLPAGSAQWPGQNDLDAAPARQNSQS